MPNDISTAFHADLKLAEQYFFKALAKFQNGVVTVLADIKTVVADTLDQAPAILAAAAEAGVEAAFASGVTGGLGAIFTVAEEAAWGVLAKQGVQLLETEALKLKALVIGNVLKANSSPVAAPSGNAVTGG